jgi:hypothetical protein
LDLFADVVVANIDVFGSSVKHIGVCDVASTFGVGEDRDWKVEFELKALE